MNPKAGIKTTFHKSGWHTSRLKFLFERVKRPILDDDEIVTAFRDGTVTLRSNRRENGFTFAEKEVGYQGVESGDLVIHAMDGFAGAIGVSDSRGKCSPVCTVVTPKSDATVYVRFWGYYLRSLAITGFIESLAKGIRERSTDFRWNDAGNLLVNFPDVITQKSIADFLDRETFRVDQLIEKKTKLISLLIEKRKSIISSAVVGRKDCNSIEQNNNTKDLTFLEQFSSRYAWNQIPAKRRFHYKKQVNEGMIEKHRLALTLGGVIDRAIDDVEGLQSSDYSTYQIFEKDNLVFKLIDLENIKTSRVGYVPRRGIMSPAYIRLEKTSKDTFSKFYYWFFYGAYINNIFNGMGGGVRQNLTQSDLLEFPIPVPDIDTQKSIADFLDSETGKLDAIVEKTKKSIELLKEFRSSLITEAVTGRLNIQK